jgi:hypothetical protein
MLGLLVQPPHTVVLIDGVFGSRPAVWHKEILMLLARGFRVIGAASMGALRAAELDRFGMIGCGAIYRAYADGRITADDEVAVLHAPAALGGAPLSLAQVNVRATLVKAVRAGVISADMARSIRTASAAIHYRDRDWAQVVGVADSPAFAAWAPLHAIDIKAEDAQAALLDAFRLAVTSPVTLPVPPRTPFLARLARHGAIDLD